jgi:hypothetical protein
MLWTSLRNISKGTREMTRFEEEVLKLLKQILLAIRKNQDK